MFSFLLCSRLAHIMASTVTVMVIDELFAQQLVMGNKSLVLNGSGRRLVMENKLLTIFDEKMFDFSLKFQL